MLVAAFDVRKHAKCALCGIRDNGVKSISSVQRYSLQRARGTVEHARLFKSISSVQRYSLQRSMRANRRSAPCAASGIMLQ